MRFAPIEEGREGSFLFARGTLCIFTTGVRLRVRALRGLLARYKKPNGTARGEGRTPLVSIFPPSMIRSPDISSKRGLENSIAWKISREIFNWNRSGVRTALRM